MIIEADRVESLADDRRYETYGQKIKDSRDQPDFCRIKQKLRSPSTNLVFCQGTRHKSNVRLFGEVATTQIALVRLIRHIAKKRDIPLTPMGVCDQVGGCGM